MTPSHSGVIVSVTPSHSGVIVCLRVLRSRETDCLDSLAERMRERSLIGIEWNSQVCVREE